MLFRLLVVAVFALLEALVVLPAHKAHAQQSSQWEELLSSRIRLVRGAARADGGFDIGVQISLDPGWKTYWRVPGDSGVPPEFNWENSDNVTDVSVQWPAPVRFRDPFGESIGYKNEVVFPAIVRTADPAGTTTVRLTIHFAVCDDICAPLRADLELKLPAQSVRPEFAGLIAQYRARVPKPVDQVEGLSVDDAHVEETGGKVDLVVDVRHDEQAASRDILVEGDERFYFASPRVEPASAPGRTRYRMRVNGAPDIKALSGSWVHFVILHGDKRVAQSWKLQ